MARVCAEHGCPTISPNRRCPEHTRQLDRARGTTAERGYGAEHVKTRAQWAPLVATGNVKCWRCGQYIAPDAPWDLGHDDDDRSRYRGPECQLCNRGVNGRK
jgi:hypothetical protein